MFYCYSGRGIWRCLYDPDAALLVTAGFDSSIKVHRLQASFSNGSAGGIVEVQDSTVKKEDFALYIPNFREHVGLMNRYIATRNLNASCLSLELCMGGVKVKDYVKLLNLEFVKFKSD